MRNIEIIMFILVFSLFHKHEDATLKMVDSIFESITWKDYLEKEDIKFIKDIIKVFIDFFFFISLKLCFVTCI